MLLPQEIAAPVTPSGTLPAAESTTDSASVLIPTESTGTATAPEVEPATLALMGVALLLLGLLQIPAGRFAAAKLLDRARQPSKSFLWRDLSGVIFAFLIGQIFVRQLVLWRHPDFQDFSEIGTVETLVLTAVGFMAPCAYILAAAASRPGGFAAVGVNAATPGYRLTFSTVRYLAGLPMFMGLAVLSGLFMTWLGEPDAKQEVAMMIRDGLLDAPWVILLFVVVVVPLLEEILFRGFLLEIVAGTFGRTAGVLVSSAAFAIAHGAAAALPIFGLAIILSLVKLQTRSLGACWFVHGLHNGGTTFLLWISTLVPVT